VSRAKNIQLSLLFSLATLALGAIVVLPLRLIAQPTVADSRPRPDRVRVPAETFMIGADLIGEMDERPLHRAVTSAFEIDRTEVTNQSYQYCVAAHVCAPPRSVGARFAAPDLPVVGVAWFDAQRYCTWIGERLPTEIEWEHAARGHDQRLYAWGNEPPTPERAVYGREESTGSPDRVGSHPAGASPFGALEMTGNVWEWTSSPYDPYAYRHPAEQPTCETALAALADLHRLGTVGFTGTNPLPTTCERVLRGGAWNYGAAGLRVSNRVHHPPTFRIVVAGFRCASD
jgi:formylglycine-generating enzyme required for sulfatase activity